MSLTHSLICKTNFKLHTFFYKIILNTQRLHEKPATKMLTSFAGMEDGEKNDTLLN
jgi:hypothetical protein